MQCSWDLLLLAALHMLLLAAGGATIYLRVRFSASDWPQVARSAYAGDVTAFEVGMTAVGCATVAVVVVGAGAAFLRKKALLLLEALCLLLLVAGSAFLAVRALVVYGRANDWQGHEWDAQGASTSELQTADRFDALYCDAQLAFVCDHATLEQVLALGLDNVAQLASSSPSDYSQSGSPCFAGSEGGDEWSEVCAVCSGIVLSYESLSSISHWVEGNCAYSDTSLQWCSNNSVSQPATGIAQRRNSSTDGQDVMEESPYALCRAQMLAQVENWTEALGIAWVAMCALLLLLLVCVALLIRSRANADALDLEEAAQSFQQDDEQRDEHPRISKV